MEVYKIISDILRQMAQMAKPGVKTSEIDKYAEELIANYGCKSYNKGYKPDWADKAYPCVSCINRNDVIAHGIPDDTEIQDGDIISFDLGIIDKDGNCGDAALSVGVGNITNAKKRLLYYAYGTMMAGIEAMKPGVNTFDVARAIQAFAMSRGFRINRRFAGHRIDKEMHLKPNIYNTIEDGHKFDVLKEGDVFCVEPMVTSGMDNMGRPTGDGWCFVTQDGKPSAFFEHMVKITKDGAEILTDHIIAPEL